MLTSRPVKKQVTLLSHLTVAWLVATMPSILKAMMELKAEYHPNGDDFEILCIGGVGADFCRARGVQPVYELRGLPDQPSFDEVRRLLARPSRCIKMNSLMSFMSVTTIMSIV